MSRYTTFKQLGLSVGYSFIYNGLYCTVRMSHYNGKGFIYIAQEKPLVLLYMSYEGFKNTYHYIAKNGAKGPTPLIKCKCGGTFIKKYNANQKVYFYGCSRFPQCKESLSMSQHYRIITQ